MTPANISDTERREVAAKLRGLRPKDGYWWGAHGFDWESFADELFDSIGYDTSGCDEWTDRLADLIEPSEPEVKYVAEVKIDGWRLEELVHDAVAEVTGIDRDALLELVKELELGAQRFVGRKWPNAECEMMGKHLADDYEMIARRIRKALGVQDA